MPLARSSLPCTKTERSTLLPLLLLLQLLLLLLLYVCMVGWAGVRS
jgi:hypothetical protein